MPLLIENRAATHVWRLTEDSIDTTMVHDGHGKGPPYRKVSEVQRFTKQPVHSTMVYDGHGKGPPYRKVYQVQEEFGPAGVGAEREAPNPNPNDFILVPRYGSKRSFCVSNGPLRMSLSEASTRGPQTGPATKTTRRTSDGPQRRPSLSVATSWCQGLDQR